MFNHVDESSGDIRHLQMEIRRVGRRLKRLVSEKVLEVEQDEKRPAWTNDE